MSRLPEFVSANADYDDEQVRASSKLAQPLAAQRPNFVFVNLGYDENEDRKQTARKAVRAQATAYSHRTAPRGAAKPELVVRLLKSADDRDALEYRHSSISTVSSSSSSARSLGRKSARFSPLHQDFSPASPNATLARKRTTRRMKPLSRAKRIVASVSSRANGSLSPGPFCCNLPDPTFMDASRRDPFDTQPVRHRDWYGKLISFWYDVVFARSTRVLKATKADLDDYTIWSRRQELQEPALFYTALFLASGIPVAEGLFPVEAAMWLRYKTIEAMKEAVADPNRALSTPVILAVGRIALHEHIYGDRKLAHNVHRPAQRRMISPRGGIANLRLPSTTVQLIVWTDALLSAESGTEPYFADVPRQLAIRSYSPQEAMHVTNHCSPKRKEHPGYDTPSAKPPEDVSDDIE